MEQTLAHLIKTARLNANLSQEKLAALCGLTRANIGHIECGKVKIPHLTTLVALSENLNLDLNLLKQKSGYSSINNMTLGDVIKNSRLNANLTLRELSFLCNVPHSTIQSIEKGKTTKPYLTTLVALCDFLKLDLTVFLKH